MRKGLFLKCLTYTLILGWTVFAAAEVPRCENHAPIFDPVASCLVGEPDTGNLELHAGTVEGGRFTTCYVRERQAIGVYVRATDPDGDSVAMSVMNVAPTAVFKDLGDGNASLLWIPDFIGPWSSAQSPFVLFFVASDGALNSQLRVVINVINQNRDPELSLPESLQVAAGNELVFQVRKWDPDLEQVTLEALDPPPGASFDAGSGIFDWSPDPADTGVWSVSFRATDRSGGECLGEAEVKVMPPSTFSLSMGVDQSILGGVVEVPIILVNPEPISGMELLIQYDPTTFAFLEASRLDARTKDWEYFYCRDRAAGLYRQVKIVGIADFPNQTNIVPLFPDSGAVVYLRFKVTNDPGLSGLLVPLEFYCFDFTDNTLSTPQGQFIGRERISLNNGGVLIKEGNTVVGDVNQNGMAYEVGDAVKLAAHLSGAKPLTSQQLINADVDQDGRMGTLTDLVLLIQRIIEQQTVPRQEGDGSEEPALVRITSESSQTSILLESECPVGGALVVFKGRNSNLGAVELAPQIKDVDLYTSKVGDELRVLLIGREAQPLPLGDRLFSLSGDGFDAVDVSLADCEGELISARNEYNEGSLPTRYALYQNYPNPFNPTTNIRYFVGANGPAKVALKVYNVAGQLVRILVDEDRSPGEHQVMWDGKNERGEDVASGVYFYRLSVVDYSENRRMLLLK